MRFWQVLLSFSFALAFSSKGDSWMAPREFDSASENGRFIAVIKPATGTNNATATIYGVTNANRTQIWCAELSNRVAPASVLVSGDGRHVVTLNNWGAVGYGGDVVAIYDSRGQIAK